MKIAVAFPGCHKRAGVERITLETANYLASRGHEVHLYSAEIAEDQLNKSIKIHPVVLPSTDPITRIVLFDRAASGKIAGEKFDALCTFGTTCPRGGFLWVQSVHKAWLEISQSTRGFTGRVKQKLNIAHPLLVHREHLHYGKRAYRKLFPLTARVANDLKRFYGIPDTDMVLMPNGFSPDEFGLHVRQRERAQQRKNLGFADTDKVVVFVANELERKGFYPLAEAISKISDPRLKLLVVGRVNQQDAERALKELHLSERSRIVGATDQVAKYYAASDVFGLPTKYEAWGMVIVEAMACGIPALTSAIAGAAEAVRPGFNGYLLEDPTDADEVRQKLELCLSISTSPEEIANSVTDYTWDSILHRYEGVLLNHSRPESV